MNEDRVTDMSNKFEEGLKRLEKIIETQNKEKLPPTSENSEFNYVEHSFGGVPIPQAPSAQQKEKLRDTSGLIVTDPDEEDELLIAS